MSEREKIFARIREALTIPAPTPDQDAQAPTERFGHLLPAVGNTFEEQIAGFRANATDLKADFQSLNSSLELTQSLHALRDAGGWKMIASHAGELTGPACRTIALPTLQTDQQYNASDLEACDVGITQCDALIAQTGSVLITTRSAGGRALSVLPPHHVVIARRDQLLPDLPAAFDLVKRKYADNYPSFISLITGPSRTGDIERILVLGAHGPKKLTILFLNFDAEKTDG
ncbi:MAG TPA: LUD domain-containing protein [Tepidisphaeraceae bacterium]